MDCYPSKSPTVLRWLSKAFTQAGIPVIEASAGKKYMFGCWEALLTIPAEAHTKENKTRTQEALLNLYQKNNPDERVAAEELLIRGMILNWERYRNAN